MQKLALFLASGFYTGLTPVAPGTAGTVPGVLIFWLTSAWALEWRLAFLGGVILVGWWACEIAGRHWGHDDGRIVIDEIAGVYITLLFAPATLYWVIVGFFVFRASDIAKPPPARWLDLQKGGFFTLADDLVAGLYGGFAMWLLVQLADWYGLNV